MQHQPAHQRDGDKPLDFNGEGLVLLLEGALWWPAHKMLVVSDLHFGKGTSFAESGQLLPPYDTETTLAAVEALVSDLQPDVCLSLGDSFHDTSAEARLSERAIGRLQGLTKSTDWIWIEGNHDPYPPTHIGGRAARDLQLGSLVFRHEPTGTKGEIAGHFHPVAKIRSAGSSVRLKCFVTDERALILPSIGAFTGGLNVCDNAFSDCLTADRRVFALGQERIYEIARENLVGDRQNR